jgi:prepilin-type N-terminal cleavage/methylation domain-containing protein
MFRRRGFTLVELMVVILIVGVLAAMAIPLIQGRIDKARAALIAKVEPNYLVFRQKGVQLFARLEDSGDCICGGHHLSVIDPETLKPVNDGWMAFASISAYCKIEGEEVDVQFINRRVIPVNDYHNHILSDFGERGVAEIVKLVREWEQEKKIGFYKKEEVDSLAL